MTGDEAHPNKLLGEGLKIDGSELLRLYTTLEAEEEVKHIGNCISVLADTSKRLASRLQVEISDNQT